MSEKLTFLKLSELTLEKARKPLTPHEIWVLSEDIRSSQHFQSAGKTPWNSIGARLYVDVRDNPQTKFYQPSKRPTRFYLTKYRDAPTGETVEVPPSAPKFAERDLHPLLVKFIYAHEHFQARARTILHEESSKKSKGYDEWLHPDIVGVYYPYRDFDPKVIEIQKELGSPTVKLFSFEMKIDLSLSNFRQAYFQAVSNSTWANEGYLVALNIEPGTDFTDELSRLNNAFGIGIIQLDPENVDQSEIIFPARSKDIDWITVSRLSEENPGFRDIIESIGSSMKIMKEHGKYDELLTDEKYREHVENKRISRTV